MLQQCYPRYCRIIRGRIDKVWYLTGKYIPDKNKLRICYVNVNIPLFLIFTPYLDWHVQLPAQLVVLTSTKRGFQYIRKLFAFVCFALPRSVIAWISSCHFLNQSRLKLKPIVPRSHPFYRGWRRLHISDASFDWFIVLCVCRDWSERLLWFWFQNIQLQTALIIF